MRLAEHHSTHQPQHLIEDSRSSHTAHNMEIVTDRRVINDDRRMTAEEIIESCHTSISDASDAIEIVETCSRERCPITDNLVEKLTCDSGERNIKFKSFPPRRKMAPAVSFTSVVEFRDCDDGRHAVTWAHSVVTDIHYRPTVTLDEKGALFYTEDETQRFRRDAKLALKIDRIQKQQDSSVASPQHNTDSAGNQQLTSPVSSIVNMATEYISRLLTSLERSPKSRSSNITITESTNTLVETLYLF